MASPGRKACICKHVRETWRTCDTPHEMLNSKKRSQCLKDLRDLRDLRARNIEAIAMTVDARVMITKYAWLSSVEVTFACRKGRTPSGQLQTRQRPRQQRRRLQSPPVKRRHGMPRYATLCDAMRRFTRFDRVRMPRYLVEVDGHCCGQCPLLGHFCANGGRYMHLKPSAELKS